jgi:hypothetical protein
VISGIFLGLVWSSASAQENRVILEPREKWTNLAAESKTDFHFTVKVPAAFKGRVEWTFADDATKRVFLRGRGEVMIMADAGKPITIKVPLETPSLNPGVAVKARLVISAYADGKNARVAAFEKTMWIFHADPFANRAEWLKELKISLYDSDGGGKTSKMLKNLKVPYDEVRNIAGVQDGVLLVAEGVSFKEEPGLADELLKAASRGVPVLCLAPSGGTFPVPTADDGLPTPGSFLLRRHDIIAKLDKRLDANAWAPDNRVVASSLTIKAEEGKVIGEIQEAGKGWSWLQVDFPDKNGRLVLCGFAVVRHWDAGPTPRYLFARLLEHVTEFRMTDAKKERSN